MNCRLPPLLPLIALMWTTSAMFGANCEGMISLALPDTTITLAKLIPAGTFAPPGGRAIDDLPAFCEVHGVLKPTDVSVIHFEVWLPAANWNGRLEGVGNGGLAGTISFGPMATALRNRYASASTDTGHTAEEPRAWLQNSDRLIDYSYRSLHLTTVAAKAIINAYYGKAPEYSYIQ